MGRSHPRQRAGVNLWEEELPRQPYPIRDVLAIVRLNNSDRLRGELTMDENMHKCMAPNEPQIGL